MQIKTNEEIQIMREGCKMLAQVVRELEKHIQVGAKASEIDKIAEDAIRANGCTPAFKGYDAGGDTPFPATVCFSMNDEVVHGIPTDQVIADGDLVKIDIGLVHKGYYADMARTFAVGAVSEQAQKLVDVTRTCLQKGIATIKDGSKLSDYAKAVQQHAHDNNFGVVTNLVGHGIGRTLHEEPQIPNYWSRRMPDFTFKAGMTVALEPMINIGTDETVLDADGWTFRTTDGSLSAHFENTVLVTDKSAEILTA